MLKRTALSKFLSWLFLFIILLCIPFYSSAEEILKASTTSLDFGYGQDTKQFSIFNDSNSSASWELSTTAQWLSFSPSKGLLKSRMQINLESPYYFLDMWPRKKNIWYVVDPQDIGIDHEGNIYVIDSSSTSIKKYNSHEEFLYEVSDQKIKYAYQVAFDTQDNVYVLDDMDPNQRLKVYDTHGNFIRAVSIVVPGVVVNRPCDLAIDNQNNIYIVDSNNQSGINSFVVHKFNSSGQYLLSFGKGLLFNSGQHVGIAIDSKGFIYTADNHYYRVHKFSSVGQLISKWGWGDKNYDLIINEDQYGGLFTIDKQDVLYIAERSSGFLKRFKTDGTALSNSWEDPQWFLKHEDSSAVAINAQGEIYLGSGNSIYKFDANGKVLANFESYSIVDPQMFNWPVGMVMAPTGTLFVLDESGHVKLFSPQLVLQSSWDLTGMGLNSIDWLSGGHLAADSKNNLYLLPRSRSSTVIKFDSSAHKIWQKDYPIQYSYLFIDKDDALYVSDYFSICKMDTLGNVIDTWDIANIIYRDIGINADYLTGSIGLDGNFYLANEKDGVFVIDPLKRKCIKRFSFHPLSNLEHAVGEGGISLSLDRQNNIFILFRINSEIQKYDSQGNFLNHWCSYGTGEGKSISGHGDDAIGVGKNGDLYLVEHKNNRVQVFSQAAVPIMVTVDRKKMPKKINTTTIDIFDNNHSGVPLSVKVEAINSDNKPPIIKVLQIPLGVLVGKAVRIAVQAEDPERGKLILTAQCSDGSPLSKLGKAAFQDNGNGTGIFYWTPSQSQVGHDFVLNFTAEDQQGLKASQAVLLRVVVRQAGGLPLKSD